jgi:hypothetical protein
VSTGSINPLAGYNPPAFYAPSTWDVIQLEGVTCPGTVRISGFDRKFVWDKKKGKGAQGVSLTYVAKDICQGRLEFQVWTEAHFEAWETFIPLFKYDPTRQNLQAVTIWNPLLSDVDITQIVVESIGPFEHQGAGLWTREVNVIEWAPPPKAAAIATPTTAQAGRNGPTVNPQAPAPTDPQQLKIQQLVTQFQQT